METPIKENTLELPIDKDTFDKFVSGAYKNYDLTINDDNYIYVLKGDINTGKIIYDKSLVNEKDSSVGDPMLYNNGKFPYFPINFKFVKFLDGVKKNTSNITLAIENIKVDMDKDKLGKAILYEYNQKGKPRVSEIGKYTQWHIYYHFGEIVKKDIKESVEVQIKDSVEADGTIHGLSVRQPWASLLCVVKDVENQSWSTNLRGKLLIHASRYESGNPWDLLSTKQKKAAKEAINKGIINDLENLPTGCYVGYATLTDCVEGDKSIWAEPGCIHWKFKDPHLFKHPIEGIKGKLGFLKYKGQLPE